jgi:hypothetical protein
MTTFLNTNFTADDMHFMSPVEKHFPNGSYLYIPIQTKHPETGKFTDLIIQTPELFTFGVSNPSFGASSASCGVSGVSNPASSGAQIKDGRCGTVGSAQTLTLSLQNSGDFQNTLNMISDRCIQHLIAAKDFIGLSKLQKEHFQKDGFYKLLPINHGKESDFLNIKLRNKLSTIYDSKTGEVIPVNDLIKVYGKAVCAIRIEGIYVTKKIISLQLKLHEADFTRTNSAPVRLLRPVQKLE